MKLEDLIAYGADVDSGLARCMGNEALYLRLVETVKGDDGFAQLEEALRDGRLDDAFEAAHALKGVLSNLALAPLAKPVDVITELLRGRKVMDYAGLLAEIERELTRLRAL